MSCPCNGCVPPKRYPACHGKCKEFKDWKIAENKKKHAIQKARNNESMCTDYTIKQMRACKREKNLSEHRADRYKK